MRKEKGFFLKRGLFKEDLLVFIGSAVIRILAYIEMKKEQSIQVAVPYVEGFFQLL